MEWTRTWEFSVSLDELWDAFNDRSEPAPWNHVFTGDPYYGRGAIEVRETSREAEGDPRHLAWSEVEAGDRVEMTVTFTATESGARLTLTRSGFGDTPMLESRDSSRFLGWTETIADFALFVENGLRPVRHLADGRSFRALALIGADVVETAGGVQAGEVREGLARAAGVLPGDLLLRLSDAPVFTRADVWLWQRLLQPGSEVTLTYLRGTEVSTGRVTVPTM